MAAFGKRARVLTPEPSRGSIYSATRGPFEQLFLLLQFGAGDGVNVDRLAGIRCKQSFTVVDQFVANGLISRESGSFFLGHSIANSADDLSTFKGIG
jgi:hypothetical protein